MDEPLNDRKSPSVDTDDILVLRRGPGANCSSIGSALDLLFLSAVAGGAALAAVAAAFGPRPRADIPDVKHGGASLSADSPPPSSPPPAEDPDASPR